MKKNKCTAIKYITVSVSWHIILVSHNNPRTELCRILPSVRKKLRNMMGDRAASRPQVSHLLMLLLSP